MSPELAFLTERHVPIELYLNGEEPPLWELVAKHVEAVRGFVADIRQCYAMQERCPYGPRLTADDVRRAENHWRQVQHDLALLQWRRTHGRFAAEIDAGMPMSRRTDAHIAAAQARPPEPEFAPTASNLRLPPITYGIDAPVLEYLGAAAERAHG